MKSQNVDLSQDNLEKLLKEYEKVEKALKSEDFKKYIEKNCYDVLDKITRQSLKPTEENEDHLYRGNHKAVATENEVTISNVTIVPVENSENYPNGFDLSKAVEYGTGAEGLNSDGKVFAAQDDWQYDINNHGEGGWWYYKDNQLHWTKGLKGSLIFEKARLEIEENINDWITDYIDKLD